MEAPSNEAKEWGEEPERREAAKRFPLWAKLAIAVCLCLGVVPCVGIVATLVVPSVVRKLWEAERAKAKYEIMAITMAVDDFAIEHAGRFPASLEEVDVRDSKGQGLFVGVPRDPWGSPYGFEPPASGGAEFRVFSLGKDGQPGGKGDDRDLDNLQIRDGKL